MTAANPSPAPRVLVVEDDEAIASGLAFNLERKGYEVEVATDGAEALDRATAGRFDLVILDVRLPGIDGFEVCQRLRRGGIFTPILMLTARGQPDDVIFGLKMGADDYVIKPFDLAELLARVEGLLRRQEWARQGGGGAPAEGEGGRQAFGEYWIDFDRFEAQTAHGLVQLSQKEISVMRVFLARPNQVVTRRELLAEVWLLPHHPNERVVDNVIVALRQHFETDSSKPRHIRSVRGVGYRFVP
ncbi:MAG TPA: response regulator transcription factor [Thermoanaerobaculia bacterium]|jgi:DNA-binding response OmpR family regulator|nr:response regulator transcription factor [Thermoanaerobaculia bacterium]